METFEADSLDEDLDEFLDHDPSNAQNSPSYDLIQNLDEQIELDHSNDQDPSVDAFNNSNLDQNNQDNVDIPSVSDSDIRLNQTIPDNEILSASERSNARVAVNRDVPNIQTRSGRNVRPRDILDL